MLLSYLRYVPNAEKARVLKKYPAVRWKDLTAPVQIKAYWLKACTFFSGNYQQADYNNHFPNYSNQPHFLWRWSLIPVSKKSYCCFFPPPFFLLLPIFPRTQCCVVCLLSTSGSLYARVIRTKPCSSLCLCLLLAKRLWFFMHSEKTLLFLPVLTCKSPQIIGNFLSIASGLWVRCSGSYSAAAISLRRT